MVYSRRLRKGWTRLAIVPHEARRVELHIATPAQLRFAIKERGKPAIDLSSHETEKSSYDPVAPDAPMNLQVVQVEEELPTQYEGRIVAAGTMLRWTSTENKAEFSCEGPLHADILVLASRHKRVQRTANKEVMVFLNYSTPQRTQTLYSWKIEYGPCSSSCGGGVRAGRRVCGPAHLCPDAPRATAITVQQCNTSPCEWRWEPGEWEECSATCGEAGVQERMLYCVPAAISIHNRSDLVRNFVSPALCSAETPDRQQPCNHIPCPAYWQEGEWTPCSRSCGRGWRTRTLRCSASDAAACGPRPPERRRRCRLRPCPEDDTCRRSDVSQYCGVRALARACELSRFRKICCHACRQFRKDNVVYD